MLAVDFSCVLVCSYTAQVVDARTGAVVAAAGGKAVGQATVSLPADGLDAGSYQYVFRTLKSGKPGTAEARFSRAFSLSLSAPTPTEPPVDPSTDPSGEPPSQPPDAPPPALPTLPLLPQPPFALPTLLPTVPAAS
jgi:hypothetical protein